MSVFCIVKNIFIKYVITDLFVLVVSFHLCQFLASVICLHLNGFLQNLFRCSSVLQS